MALRNFSWGSSSVTIVTECPSFSRNAPLWHTPSRGPPPLGSRLVMTCSSLSIRFPDGVASVHLPAFLQIFRPAQPRAPRLPRLRGGVLRSLDRRSFAHRQGKQNEQRHQRGRVADRQQVSVENRLNEQEYQERTGEHQRVVFRPLRQGELQRPDRGIPKCEYHRAPDEDSVVQQNRDIRAFGRKSDDI